MTKDELKRLFASHSMNDGQLETSTELRQRFYNLAGTVMLNTPVSPEQAASICKLHEALLYANLALVVGKR
jgi:hypothetical protein